jgi:hypothetical protein
VLFAAAWTLIFAASGGAQSTTGTISGRVVDGQHRVVPGVTITVESPNLQGVRSVVTSDNGDYIIDLLPPGVYKVTFELSGFQRVEQTFSLAPTQVYPLEVTLGLAKLAETVDVTAPSVEVLTQTAQMATNFRQDLIASLPTSRDLNASLLMASSVHPTGPNNGYSISGGMSYENLFLVNGVTVNENVRGQAHDLYIEDAIQETTVATGGISAQYGRFGGGVVNVITRSGGNSLAGSLRTTLHNDRWRALTPFEERSIAADPARRDTRVNSTVPAYEYTLGGPVLRDKLWFFTAGRIQRQETRRQLAITNTPFDAIDSSQRFEGKGTFSLSTNHRFEGAFTKVRQNAENTSSLSPTGAGLMDLRSLHNPQRRMDLTTINYSGVVSPRLFLEARYSARNETTSGQGAGARDLIDGTLLLDRQRSNFRYWSPTFCGVCTPEQRDNTDVFVKGSYFYSTSRFGSHNALFGYDSFNDHRVTNNYQSGSDYRIFGTTSIIQGTGTSAAIYPQFMGDGTTTIMWNPVLIANDGVDLRVHSLFLNDNWRVSSRVTANLGLRYDKNHGVNGVGQLVARDSAWSPRLGVIFDPTGSHTWSVSGSFAKYVSAIATTIGDISSPGGNPNTYMFTYRGPSINANPTGSLTSTPDAIRQVFDWFFANGGTNMPLAGAPTIRGVTPLIRGSLASPNVLEYAGGVSRQLRNAGAVRVDFVYRNYDDFYTSRTDMSTGRVADSTGRQYDLTLIENSDLLDRQYAGLTTQITYRVGSHVDLGGAYTLSRAWGNFDGETAGGPATSSALQYPEYKREEWSYPTGDLAIDQRHRARLWANYRVPQVEGLSLGLLQILESGVPYGALSTSGVNVQPFVTNPGYAQLPPAAGGTVYFYTSPDAFRTEGQKRTDLAANYTYTLPGPRRLQLFAQVQVLNLFGQYQLCGCGASTVFQNGGSIAVGGRINTAVRTSVTHPTSYQTFNPFTSAPVRGVNWDLDPAFGTALSRLAYTTPRTVRFSLGFRF